MRCTVEIVSIGNELLIGKIANTNAQWLAKQITTLGGDVKRISNIGDVLAEIATSVVDALTRTPSFIITTGGLGPTFDDLTVEALAQTFDRPLTVDENALKMVKEKYRQYEAVTLKPIELTPVRLKMATLPEGGKPLRNPIGTAPGILLTEAKTKIIALPGVPAEMKAIYKNEVEPLIKEHTKETCTGERSLWVWGIMESTAAPLINMVMQKNPYVYIKSHPKATESHPRLEFHLRARAESQQVAEHRVEVAVDQLVDLIVERGGQLTSRPEDFKRENSTSRHSEREAS
jgi:molybdenum cofactor synthesis domain-containing protein